MAVYINPMGIRLREMERSRRGDPELAREFPIEDISFCNTDRAINERIFSWICRNQAEGRLDCHAVLCSTEQKAQTMAIVLSRAFQIAYKNWRIHSRGTGVSRSGSKFTSSGSNVGGGGGDGGTADKHLRPNGSGASGFAPPLPPPSSSASASSSSPSSAVKVSNDVASSSVAASTSSEAATSQLKTTSQKSTHFSDEVNVVSDNGTANAVTSPVYDRPSTSGGFMGSSIMDPDLEDTMRGVDCLNADYDLEGSDTN